MAYKDLLIVAMTTYTFNIFRYNPQKDKEPYYREYSLTPKQNWSVLDCLNEIRWHYDGSLSFRRSCRSGICGSCAMNINGKNMLACETQIQDIKTKRITIKPLPYYEIIKDLTIDLESFFDAIEKIKPYIISMKGNSHKCEGLQSPEARALLDGLYECILCGACTSSCPSFWNSDYPGPAALLQAARFTADSRDKGEGERFPIINKNDGVWRCHTIFNCVEACPKGLNPTKAIQQLKRTLIKDVPWVKKK